MEMIFESPYVRLFLAVLASSLALSILNLFHKVGNSEKWYFDNRFLILIISTIFVILVTNFTGFAQDWQWRIFIMILAIMTCFLVAVFKGQEIVDSWINKIAEKVKDKINSGSKD